MPKDLRTINVDAVAIKLLDYYEDGEYAYEEGDKKTDKQRNLKRDFKQCIVKFVNDESCKSFTKAMQDTLIQIEEPARLRDENRMLREKVKGYEDKSNNYKDLVITTYREQYYKEIKSKLDAELVENLESSRRVNRKLMDRMCQVENQLSSYKDRPSKESFEHLKEQNMKLNTQICKTMESKKQNEKLKKKLQLESQLQKLMESSDEEE